MTNPTVPNSNNSPSGTAGPLNALGAAITGAESFISNLIRSVADQNVNLNPDSPPPVMKTLVYSPDVQVLIVSKNNVEYDVSADIVRGGLVRNENAVSSFSVSLPGIEFFQPPILFPGAKCPCVERSFTVG